MASGQDSAALISELDKRRSQLKPGQVAILDELKKRSSKPAKPGSLTDLTEQSKQYPVMAGPVFPAGAMIPAAVGAGVEAGGRAMGMPGWASTGAGLLAG